MAAAVRLQEDLDLERLVVIDGATGTELERRGAPMDDSVWCAMATVTAPELLRSVHEDYIRAGARVVTANTFSSNRMMLEPAGLGDRFEELNRKAVALTLEARDRCGGAETVTVAASMSHQLPLPVGTDRRFPDGLPSSTVAADRFKEMAMLLADAGAELILLEMMSDPPLANLAIEAVRETGLPYWIGFSVRSGPSGEPVSYHLPELGASDMFRQIALEGAAAAGIMHSNVNVTGPAIEQLREVWTGPVTAYPDSGYFTMPHWQFEDIIAPELLVDQARSWWDSGARVFGGCCGLGVEHVEALARMENRS